MVRLAGKLGMEVPNAGWASAPFGRDTPQSGKQWSFQLVDGTHTVKALVSSGSDEAVQGSGDSGDRANPGRRGCK